MPGLKVSVETFQGSIQQIEYMLCQNINKTDEVVEPYFLVSQKQDLEPRYYFERQENGKYKGTRIDGGFMSDNFLGADSLPESKNPSTRTEIGEFTLDEINTRIQAYSGKAAEVALTMKGTTMEGDYSYRRGTVSWQTAQVNLQPLIQQSNAIAKVGDRKIVEQLSEALKTHTGTADRIRDYIGIYENATDRHAQFAVIAPLQSAMCKAGDALENVEPEERGAADVKALAQLFTTNRDLPAALKKVFKSVKRNDELEVGKNWLQFVEDAEKLSQQQTAAPTRQR